MYPIVSGSLRATARRAARLVGAAALCAAIPPLLFATAHAQTAPAPPPTPVTPMPSDAPAVPAPPAVGPDMSSMPGMNMPGMKMPGMSMTMPSSIDLLTPMSQEASGTAWLPSASPMYGKMIMRPNDDMLMLHGDITPRYVDVGSERGADKIDAPNWFMGMYSHPMGKSDQLGLRAMMSLDPITEGGYGYPLLYQTGETWHGIPLHDRQHPHNLFDELSVDYSHQFAPQTSGYFYLGYPGEPALGPPTFMHRLIALDLPDAPIGHHWQDSTHITFGVATAGIDLASRVKLEGSIFTGREPGEDRYDFERARFDSQSARISYNWDSRDAFQLSYGRLHDPESDGVDQHRITSSWIYDLPLHGDANFTTTVSFGQILESDAVGRSNSLLAEGDYNVGRNAFFGRAEWIQKSGVELYLPGAAYNDDLYALRAYTLGYLRDITHGRGIDTGFGGDITLDTNPPTLSPFYGNGAHVGFQVMLRFRPSRLQMDNMAGMTVMSHDAAREDKSAFAIKATLAPDAPAAREKVALTVAVLNPTGKPVIGAKVSGESNMTTMDMGTSKVVFVDNGNGTYVGSVAFAMAGAWKVTVRVVLPTGEKVTREFEFTAR